MDIIESGYLVPKGECGPDPSGFSFLSKFFSKIIDKGF